MSGRNYYPITLSLDIYQDDCNEPFCKRVHPYHHWEPIYIGTNEEPWYDERLTWEGRADKMDQGFRLCLLDYEFYILDNAFLIHRLA